MVTYKTVDTQTVKVCAIQRESFATSFKRQKVIESYHVLRRESISHIKVAEIRPMDNKYDLNRDISNYISIPMSKRKLTKDSIASNVATKTEILVLDKKQIALYF